MAVKMFFIPYKAGPLAELPFVSIWGIFAAIALLAAILFVAKEAKKERISLNHVYDVIFYIIIGSFIGARIAYLIEYWENISGFIGVFKIWEGGLSFIGGLIGGFLSVFVYIKAKKLDFWKYADLFTPAVVLGHAIGRIGCILGDGGHIGRLTTIPFGALVNGEVRHLTALYEFIFLALLFAFLIKAKDRKVFKKSKGLLFLAYLVAYSIGRFVIDLFRIDPSYFGLTMTQWILIAIFLMSGCFIIKKLRKWGLKE